LVKGLVVVTAIASEDGDYESIKQIVDVSPAKVEMSYSSPKTKLRNQVDAGRLIDPADLVAAHAYNQVFTRMKEHYPGSTAIGASTEMLNQLRAGKDVEFHFVPQGKLSPSRLPLYHNQQMLSCTLRRAEPEDVAVPVLLNDQRVELPALHASCTLTSDQAEPADQKVDIYYLDQPANPLTLYYHLGPVRDHLQVIKIMLPPQQQQKTATSAGAQMEQTLAEKKPVQIYGIYFDFNSATIRPESEAVLKQIADIMQKNPAWKLNVSGHTDNIGDDSFNLGLSQRRAAAVKDALVTEYHIAPDRLATAGYGASQPIETNKTLEGRARNRRVELQRQ
jgi:outer membrane protein OmpA-like peptidoglycan-associated protein